MDQPGVSPIPADIDPNDFSADLQPSGFVARCRVSTFSFIAALVLLFPWIPLLASGRLGLTLKVRSIPIATYVGMGLALLMVAGGVVGMVRTAHRKRRGRGFAMAAIVVGLLATASQFVFGIAIYRFMMSNRQAAVTVEILRTRLPDVETAAPVWLETVTSRRFKVAVSSDEFSGWLSEVIEEHGQLQDRKRARPYMELAGTAYKFRYTGQFVKGPALIELVVGMEPEGPRIDDIRVADSSPLTWQPDD